MIVLRLLMVIGLALLAWGIVLILGLFFFF